MSSDPVREGDPALKGGFFSRRCLAVLIVIAMTAVTGFVLMNDSDSSVAEAETSGSCGEHATWSYDADSKTLTISGTGLMTDYSAAADRPWHSIREAISTVIVNDGVTSIGKYAFWSFSNLTEIELADSITSIGSSSFSKCTSLESIVFPANTVSMGSNVMSQCTSLKTVVIGDKVESISNDLIYNCSSIEILIVGKGFTTGSYTFADYNFYDANDTKLDNTKPSVIAGHSFVMSEGNFVMVDLEVEGKSYKETSETESASISAVNLSFVKYKAESDSSITLDIGLKGGNSASFDAKAISTLSTGDLKIDSVNKDTLDDATKKLVGDNPVYDISFGANTSFGEGKATFTISYTLPEGKNASDLKVYYIKDGAISEKIDAAYADGKVSFSTNHLSTYSIGFEESSSGGNNGGEFPIAIVVVIAVVAIAAIGGAFFFMQKKKA